MRCLGNLTFLVSCTANWGTLLWRFPERMTDATSVIEIMANYERKLEPLVEAFEGFRDLEGDEDEEEYRLSWDPSSDDDVDEPDPR